MAEVILMPRLSDTMTEGVIAAWHKKVGDTVKKGDLLAEIETDKATMELESYKDGILLHTGGDKGTKIQVDELLAIVGKAGEDVSSLLKAGSSPVSNPQSATTPKESAVATQSLNQPINQSQDCQARTKNHYLACLSFSYSLCFYCSLECSPTSSLILFWGYLNPSSTCFRPVRMTRQPNIV